MTLRTLIKPFYLRYWVLPRIHRTYRTLPMAQTFQDIYRTKAWGDNGKPFCSGGGSRGPVVDQYCERIAGFIRDRGIRRVVDLGCGDFTVGSRILELTSREQTGSDQTGVKYIGVDVVPELIDYLKNTVQEPRAGFYCADMAKDKLPQADLCIVRQVLQHLSNQEIASVLTNLEIYPNILVSEDLPLHPRTKNRDKPHGPDVRSCHGSGVYLDEPPFSKTVTESWNLALTEDSILRTVLLQPAAMRKG